MTLCSRQCRPVTMTISTMAIVIGAILGTALPLAAQQPEVVHNRFRAPARGAPELVEQVEIGLEGGEEQIFYRPANLFFDGDGNVYVPDGSHHSVLVFASDGTFLRRIGEEGSGPGEINAPAMAYISWDGHLVVPDMQNQRTTWFTRDGDFVRSAGMGGGNMRIVIGGAVGQIPTMPGEYIKPGPPVLPFVAEGMGDLNRDDPMLVDIVDDGGAVLRSFGERYEHDDQHLANILNQISLAWNQQGRIAVAPRFFTEIKVYNAASGELELVFDRGLAFTPVEPSAELQQERSPDGSQVRVSLAVSADPITVDAAWDPDGRLWVLTYLVDQETRLEREEEGEYEELIRLEIFSPEGELLAALPLDEPATIIRFSPEGELWLLDTDYVTSARRYSVVWP